MSSLIATPINQFLVAESGRIGTDIARRSIYRSPWNAMVKKDVWPNEMGNTISHLTYERTLPSSTPTWQSYTYNVGSAASNCVPTAVTIAEAQTLRQYSLETIALESSRICVENLRAPMAVKDQLDSVFSNLTNNTAWAWKERYTENFTDACDNLIAIGSSAYSLSSSAMPVVYGGSLTNSILEELYLRLIQDGAADDSTVTGRVDGVPVFPLIIGMDQSRALMRASEYRTDIRENDAMVPELLKPLGVRVDLLGFMHVIDRLPRRWDVVGGAWVERKPYASTAATYGNKFDISSAYRAALYEDAYIFSENVFNSLVPKPITAPGGSTSFSPVDYSGTWKWNNYLSDENPDGTIGYFRGILTHSPKPVHPWAGAVIRFKRCNSATFTTCA